MLKLLILVPTWQEYQLLRSELPDILPGDVGQFEVCGFGAIAAAAQAARLIGLHRPQQVILAGIAGAIGDALRIGAAYDFPHVACYGIGTGTAENYSSASEMGWKQWAGRNASGGVPDIGDEISLHAGSAVGPCGGLLLTSCSASNCDADVRLRVLRYPDATAEDMEGFAVAVACRLADVPLSIIRGISNRAGDRNKRCWKISESLRAVANLLRPLLAAGIRCDSLNSQSS